MLRDFLPQHADNAYRGSRLAPWIFAVVVFMRVLMSLNSLLNARTVARFADGIPIHTYSPAAEQTAVSLFSLLGLYSFIICLICILVLILYRNLIPAVFGLLLLQFIGAKLIAHFLPIIRTGTPPGIYVNWVLLAFIVIGLALSIRWRESDA
jgi:predicted tellurium resistance membrane protein TerC